MLISGNFLVENISTFHNVLLHISSTFPFYIILIFVYIVDHQVSFKYNKNH